MPDDPKKSVTWNGSSGDVEELSEGPFARTPSKLICDGVMSLGTQSTGETVAMPDVVAEGVHPWPNKKADEMRGSLCLCLVRPARRVTKYSHARPRFSHRSHVGFFLLHLTLEAEHAWQLSRSFGAGRLLEVVQAVLVDEDRVAGGFVCVCTCTESSVLAMVQLYRVIGSLGCGRARRFEEPRLDASQDLDQKRLAGFEMAAK